MRHWPGLTREKIEQLGNRYEAACVIGAQRAHERYPHDGDAAAAEFVEIRRGIRFALATELRSLGCPESEVAQSAADVINSQVAHRIKESARTVEGSDSIN